MREAQVVGSVFLCDEGTGESDLREVPVGVELVEVEVERATLPTNGDIENGAVLIGLAGPSAGAVAMLRTFRMLF